MEILFDPIRLLLATARDVVPVLLLLVVFQTLVLKRPIPRPGRIVFQFAPQAGNDCQSLRGDPWPRGPRGSSPEIELPR